MMSLIIAAIIAYIIILLLVCLRIIFETHSTNKTLSYILFCIFIPIIGIVFYLTFGINYWRKKRYGKKQQNNSVMLDKIKKDVKQYNATVMIVKDIAVAQNAELASMILLDIGSPLTANNKIKLLINGESKFKEMLEAVRQATHHVHVEYYIYEYDNIGTQLIDLLIEKAKDGVAVRFIYDDFGSPAIKKKTEQQMKDAGIEIYPFHKVRFYFLANRINYRNHRKIVVIDGKTGFVGGINVSDKYINPNKEKLFWRDTHVRIDGPAVYFLQYLFTTDWSFCCGKPFSPGVDYFPEIPAVGKSFVQVVASGPDSNQPSVLYSLLQAIYLAKQEILITTPYFIPGDSIVDALRIAALSGLKVKLLVPGICDSKIVNTASKSYYNDLLQAGVEIYLYQKGFVHAKTLISDGKLFVVGTANMDYRSFELNFEVNAIVYDADLAIQMRNIFFDDLKDALKINEEEWFARRWYTQLPERIARLLSPVL